MPLEQKLAPLVEALPGLGRRLNDPRIGGDAPDVGQCRVAVVTAGLGEIDLADEDHVRRLEHGRILQRLVFALGDRQQHDAQVLPQIVGGRTDEIADILDDQEVEVFQVKGLQGAAHHFRFEMADGAGGDLHDGGAGLAQPLRVVVGREVAYDHAGLQLRPQFPHALADKGGLARAGGGKKVQHQQAARAEEAAVALGEAVVLFENRTAHFDSSVSFALGLVGVVVGMSMRVVMLVVVVVPRAVLVIVLMVMPMIVIMARAVGMGMGMAVTVLVFMLVVMSTHTNRRFSGQSASAILTHQSISKEASSISRPARSSPLTMWHPGHSANISSDWNSWVHVRHQNRAGTRSMASLEPSASVPGVSTSNANSSASGTTPLSAPMRSRMVCTRTAPACCAWSSAMFNALCIIDNSCTGSTMQGISPPSV